jgi:hypothetical protein
MSITGFFLKGDNIRHICRGSPIRKAFFEFQAYLLPASAGNLCAMDLILYTTRSFEFALDTRQPQMALQHP